MGRWISRDPIEELGGINLFCFVGNSCNDLYDVLGQGCQVSFNCTLASGAFPKYGPSVTRNCKYNCVETPPRIETPIHPEVTCAKVPQNLTMQIDVQMLFCEKCRPIVPYSVIFTESDFKVNCSRADCRGGCDHLARIALAAAKTPAAKAAALAAKALCIDTCNTVCRNP
jgi:hypothetical protein